jgi:hypothetical protein
VHKGVELHNTPRCEEIEERFGNLISSIIDSHKAQTERQAKARRRKRVEAA